MHPTEETDVALALLEKKYSGKDWACFDEFGTSTNSKERKTYIDFYAVGLWANNEKLIAFEIKTFRQDFTNDVNKFIHKHEYALGASNEFYYVCPQNLIDKTEVPEVAGLIYVDKSCKLKTIKQAQYRNKDIKFSLSLFQALAKRATRKPLTDIKQRTIKLAGEEISEEEFNNKIELLVSLSNKEIIKKEAVLLFKEEKQKNLVYERFYKKIKSAAYGERAKFVDSYKDVQKNVISKLKTLEGIEDIVLTLEDLREALDLLPKIKSSLKKIK